MDNTDMERNALYINREIKSKLLCCVALLVKLVALFQHDIIWLFKTACKGGTEKVMLPMEIQLLENLCRFTWCVGLLRKKAVSKLLPNVWPLLFPQETLASKSDASIGL